MALIATTNESEQTSDGQVLPNSNAVRISGRQWLFVGAVMLALLAGASPGWKLIEGFEPGNDYRVPYTLGSDYWLYSRHCRHATDLERIPVIGDSVIWGHYVPPDQTLSHHLNQASKDTRFTNLGLDGTHPAALGGLTEDYAKGIAGRAVVLHFNPLWITSTKHDLQTEKEFHFNHPSLVPQFETKIPCYKAPFSKRLRIVMQRRVPFLGWTSHLKIAYFEGLDLQRWTLTHPYTSPLDNRLAQPAATAPEAGTSWLDRGAKQRRVAWVELDSSLQWRFFRQMVERLKARGSEVFVLVGPFNEHMLDEASAEAFSKIKSLIGVWLQDNDVPHLLAEPLPSPLYADTSHPLAEGYALLAQQLLSEPSFQRVIALSSQR
ncbi:MAG: hypothetical protein ACYTAS_09820 [Planctomycetota bacterium]